jgi:hypothetical protein
MSAGAWLWLAIVAAAAGWWRVDVYFHPFAPCRRCDGTGRNKGSRSKAYGLCRHGPRRTRLFAKKAAARHDRRGK